MRNFSTEIPGQPFYPAGHLWRPAPEAVLLWKRICFGLKWPSKSEIFPVRSRRRPGLTTSVS